MNMTDQPNNQIRPNIFAFDHRAPNIEWNRLTAGNNMFNGSVYNHPTNVSNFPLYSNVTNNPFSINSPPPPQIFCTNSELESVQNETFLNNLFPNNTFNSTFPFLQNQYENLNSMTGGMVRPAALTDFRGVINPSVPMRCKRKTDSPPPMATKQHITEEKMALHMSQLHISSESVPNCPKTEPVENRQKRLYMCEEMRRLQTESIVPQSLLHKMQRPCTALVLWQPPQRPFPVPNLENLDEEEEENNNSDGGNNNNNNNIINNNNNNNNNIVEDEEMGGMDLDMR